MAGNINARMVEEGELPWVFGQEEEEKTQKRHSIDKVQNRQGKDLLEMFEGRGMAILNGNMRGGGEEGEETLIGSRGGNSVIDYAICDEDSWEDIEGMRVGTRKESDHRPIEVTVRCQRSPRKRLKYKIGRRRDAKNIRKTWKAEEEEKEEK